MDALDIVIANVPEVVSFRVTFEVIIELIEEHTGNQLCVLCHGQLVRQFRNLTAHLQDLPKAWKVNTHAHRIGYLLHIASRGSLRCGNAHEMKIK